MDRRHIGGLLGAGFVLAGVSLDKGDRSALIFYIPGMRPGTRYALCQQIRSKNSIGNKTPICHYPCSVYRTLPRRCSSVKLLLHYLDILAIKCVSRISEHRQHRPTGMVPSMYVVIPSNRLSVGVLI